MIGFPHISGLGLVTPLGDSPSATFDALLAGGAITDHVRLPGDAERGMALAQKAALQALDEAKWTTSDRRDAALIIGTSKGTIERLIAPADPPHQHIVIYPYITAGEWSDLAITGPRLVFSAACASGLHALIRAALMIAHGEVDRALVVAYEASTHPLFLATFRQMGAISPAGKLCRPFDQHRAGFLMSEGAAAVCLERKNSPGLPGIERVAIAGDATHLTGGNESGHTLRRILRHVIDSRPADLIHAHGTGTVFNDPVELAAIESCIAGPNPAVYSHKGALGHTLGASGLIAVVLSCLMHQRGRIPPNVHTTHPLPAGRVEISSEVLPRPIHRSIAIAAGFGGAMGAVSLVSD